MKRCIRALAVFLAAALFFPPQGRGVAMEEDIIPLIVERCTYSQPADLSKYKLNEEAFDRIYNQLHNEGSLPWYTTGSYSYHYNEQTGILLGFTPENLDPQKYDRTLYEQKLAEVMDRCIHEGMDAVQIALSVHDYLILNSVYDETLQANTAYDLLVNGTTVCAGYTSVYMDILNRAGVPCVSVTSTPMEHTWNLVQIDGQWYHVDVTWDDPTPDHYGFVSHRYFLVTDDEIADGEDPHYDWNTDITCDDTRFTDAYWKDVESGIFFESSAVSYLMRSEEFTNYICRREEATGKQTVLYTDDKPYVNIGYGNYTYQHRGLALHGDRLWFGTLDALRSVRTDGSGLQTEYRYHESDMYLYSFHIDGDTAYLTTADHSGNTAAATADLPASGAHIHSYTETVQQPQCEAGGYTTSVCDCGLSCQSDPIAPTGHTLTQIGGKAATIFSSGFSDEKCSVCEYTQTVQFPRLTLTQWLLEIFSWLGLASTTQQAAVSQS